MGLLRTAPRTPVATSVATRVHHAVSSRQQGRWAQQTAAPPAQTCTAPAPAPAPDSSSMLGRLQQLGELRQAGVLTDAESEAQKARILHGG